MRQYHHYTEVTYITYLASQLSVQGNVLYSEHALGDTGAAIKLL